MARGCRRSMTRSFFRSSLRKTMRLRTRLALAFALLAVVPLVLVVPRSIARVSAILSGDLEARLKSSASVADAGLREVGLRSRLPCGEGCRGVALEGLRQSPVSPRPSRHRPGRDDG